jgi:hypothetical protein
MAAARAADADCVGRSTEVERAICADPALVEADDKVAETFASAMAVSLDPGGSREEQSYWRERLHLLKSPSEIAASLARRLEVLGKEKARFDRLEPARDMTEATARAACPALFGDPDEMQGVCMPKDFGDIGTVDGRAFAYGLYGFRVGEYNVATVAVVFERQEDDRLRALFAPRDGATFYAEPKLVRQTDRTLLQLPGFESGTGNFNRERLFVRRHGAWVDVDVVAWLRELVGKLPGGYEALKGIYPDYVKMTAATPLWRKKTDGNCCPTGGRADIRLGWQGDRLLVKSVQVKLGAKYAGQF